MAIRVLQAEQARVETGAVRFGDDWPGIFIRGDDSLGVALAITTLQSHFASAALPVSVKMSMNLLDGYRREILQDVMEGKL